MELDKIIQEELNNRSHRLKALKVFGLNEEGVEYMSGRDIVWIEQVCEERRFDPQPYIEYYQTKFIKSYEHKVEQ